MRHRTAPSALSCFALLLSALASHANVMPGPEKNTLAAGPNGLGTKRVAVIMFNWADNPVQPFTAAQVREQIFTSPTSTNAFFAEISFRQLAIAGFQRADGDVFGWYTLPITGAAWDKNVPSRVPELNRAAAANGFNAANFDVIVYMHNAIPGAWGGQAFGGADRKGLELNGLNRVNAAHEILHILGLDHANGLRCTELGARVPVADTFSSVGYGDPFDIQGGAPGIRGYGHPSAYAKARMGWFTSTNFQTILPTQNGSYLYAIAPIERASTGCQCVRIRVPRSRIPLQYGWGADTTSVDLFYYVEFRQPSPFEAIQPTDPVATGVTIRLGTDIDTNHMTMLVDTVPATDTFEDAPLTAGRSFTDAVAGLTIRVVRTSTVEAIIEVTTSRQQTFSTGPKLLWATDAGVADIQTLNAYGWPMRDRVFGPLAGMRAMDYDKTGYGSNARLLWARSDGAAVLFQLDPYDNIVSIRRHGPFANWTARSFQRLADGTARLLWSRTDGLGSLWTLDANDNYVTHRYYGPSTGWTMKGYQRLADGTARLLASRNDGQTVVSRLDAQGNIVANAQLGTFPEWTANGYERLSDGTARIAWTRIDGLSNLWTVDGNDGYMSHRSFTPGGGWKLQTYSER